MLKKRLLLIFILLLYFSISIAQTKRETISGTIKTADGKPAEFISVSLKGTTYGCVSDEYGRFQFEAPSGNYIMVVHSISAHRKEFPITIESGGSTFPDLTVMEDKNQLEEVVVTGQLSPQSLRNSVYKVKVINSEQIRQRSATNVESLLNTEIGIRISNDMALGETNFEVMGMSGNNIKVLMDGIPMIDRSQNKQSLSQIDINTIERIEIVEGPMSVLYGTDALAGVINIITKKGKQSAGNRLSVVAKIQEETLGDEYDFGEQKGQHMQSVSEQYTFQNGLYTSANFAHNEFGGWKGELTGRAKKWSSKDQYLAGGTIGFEKSNYGLFYKLDYLHESILKKGDIDGSNKAKDEEFLDDRFTHQLQGHWTPSNRWKFTFAGSHQNYQRDKRNIVVNFSTREKKISQAEDDNDDTEYSAFFGRFGANFKVRHNLSLLGGFEYENDRGSGDKVEGGKASITNNAFFFSAEYSPIEWMSIRPGFRSTFNSKYDAPAVIPSVNFKFNVNSGMDVRLSYARGFRAPTLQELYYEFYHVNGGGFWVYGNSDLKAERSDSYMGSYTWRPLHNEKIRLTSTLSGFANFYKDRIQRIEFEEISSNLKYYNTGKYRTIGLTFENSLVWKKLKASASLSYIGRYNTLSDDINYASAEMDNMRYSPEVSANVTYNWSRIAVFNLFYKFTGGRDEYKIQNDKLVLGGLDGYHWADLTLTRPIWKYLSVSAGIRNIFDVTNVNNKLKDVSGTTTATSTQTLIACGRSYFVGLSFNFNK